VRCSLQEMLRGVRALRRARFFRSPRSRSASNPFFFFMFINILCVVARAARAKPQYLTRCRALNTFIHLIERERARLPSQPSQSAAFLNKRKCLGAFFALARIPRARLAALFLRTNILRRIVCGLPDLDPVNRL
jgi:hypothetical protein